MVRRLGLNRRVQHRAVPSGRHRDKLPILPIASAAAPAATSNAMPPYTKSRHAVPVGAALDGAAALGPLRERLAESSARLDIIRPLLPPALRASVLAGPIDELQWCLLVANPAAAAKVRQLLPAFRLALEARGRPVAGIRIRVHQAPSGR